MLYVRGGSAENLKSALCGLYEPVLILDCPFVH